MRACPTCERLFYRPPSKSGRPYCSRDCFYKARYGRFRITAKCIQCGGKFLTSQFKEANSRGKFCSFKCRCNYNKRRILCSCANCSTLFEKKVSQHRRHTNHFCSSKCSRKFHRGERHPLFNGGSGYGPGWRAIADRIRHRDKTCRRCGKTKQQNGRKLDVHHIIPFDWFGYDMRVNAHRDSNLITLCKSCHKYVEYHGI